MIVPTITKGWTKLKKSPPHPSPTFKIDISAPHSTPTYILLTCIFLIMKVFRSLQVAIVPLIKYVEH